MKVTPLSITSLAWPLADILPEHPQRVADVRGFDLKTPLGQFQLLESYAGASTAASLFQVSVVISMTEFEQVIYSFIPDVKTISIKKWNDETTHVNMVAVIYSATLRDWYRLAKTNDQNISTLVKHVRACIHPSKLWSHLDKCNSIY